MMELEFLLAAVLLLSALLVFSQTLSAWADFYRLQAKALFQFYLALSGDPP